MALISILTPTYNKPSYLRQAIQSVLAQTEADFEYFVVDNSIDGKNRDVVRQFSDRRIRYTWMKVSFEERKKNYLPAVIVNRFFSKIRGKYFIFLADDDLLLPDCFSVMSGFLKSNRNADVCYHDQAVLYSFGKLKHWEPVIRGSDKKLAFPLNNPKDMLDGGQIMFRTKILHDITNPWMPEEWKSADVCDKLFMEKIWRLHSFYPVKKILSLHRVVSSTTHMLRNPLKYYIYVGLSRCIPVAWQHWFGLKTGKRRSMEDNELNRLQSWYKKYYATE